MSNAKKTATDIIIDNLIEKVINSPLFSWTKLWKNIANGNEPYNPISNIVYSNTNNWILKMYAMIKGTNQFCTEKQAETKDGYLVDENGNKVSDIKDYKDRQILKHKLGIPLFKFQWIYKDTVTGKRYYQNQLAKLPKSVKDNLKKSPMWNYFTVYPITQFKGLPVFELPKVEKKNTKIDTCQKVIDKWLCKINIGLDNSSAYYSPSVDIINMPDLQAFKDNKAFYAVAFHEIAHSTGAKNRLDRDLSGMFGNDKYAKEELIAELTSVLLAQKFDILTDNLKDNTVAYLQSWTKRLQDKRTELYSGLSSAMKAYNYILENVG